MQPIFLPSLPSADTVRQVLNEHREGALACIDRMRDRGEADLAIHELRKHGKRIRGLLRLIQCAIPEADYSAANAFTRGFAKWFSDARDALVSLELLRSLDEELGGQIDSTEVVRILEQRHCSAIESESLGNAIWESGRQLSILGVIIDQMPLEAVSYDTLISGCQSIYDRAKEEMDLAIGTGSPEDFHEWRKRVKYLSFHFQWLEEGDGGDLHSEMFNNLASDLGRHHDLAVLVELIIGMERHAPIAAAYASHIEPMRRKLEEKVARDGGRLLSGELMSLLRKESDSLVVQ